MIRVLAFAFIFILGFYLGRNYAPRNVAAVELAFRSFILGCVYTSEHGNKKCSDMALDHKNDIIDILDEESGCF